MNYLPIEIWHVILNKLPIKDLLTIRQVCKNFNEFTRSSYFMDKYPDYGFIKDYLSWKQTRFNINTPTRKNDKDIHLLGLCIQYEKFDKFENLLTEIRFKRIRFRMNWVDMFYYAGINGTDDVLNYLINEVPSYGFNHRLTCWESSIIHGNIDLAKTINIGYYYWSSRPFLTKLFEKNNETGINYIIDNKPNILNRIWSFDLLKIIINNRNDKLIKRSIEYNKHYGHIEKSNIYKYLFNILSTDKDAINWASETRIIDLDNEEIINKLKSFQYTDILLKIIENGNIDCRSIDWTAHIIRAVKYNNNYGLSVFRKLLKFVNTLQNIEIDHELIISEAIQYKLAKDIIIILKWLESNEVEIDYSKILKDCFVNDRTKSYNLLKHLYLKTISI